MFKVFYSTVLTFLTSMVCCRCVSLVWKLGCCGSGFGNWGCHGA